MKSINTLAILTALLLAIAASGCADNDDDNTADPQPDMMTGEPDPQPEPQPEPDVAGPVDCDESDLFNSPFSGPGFDDDGALIDGIEGELVVVSTFAVAKEDEEIQNEFDAFIGPIVGSMMATEGLVGFSLGGSDLCGSGRTISIWQDEASMMRFVTSQAHADAMANASRLLDVGRFARWTVAVEDMPVTWEQAIEEIDKAQPVRY